MDPRPHPFSSYSPAWLGGQSRAKGLGPPVNHVAGSFQVVWLPLGLAGLPSTLNSLTVASPHTPPSPPVPPELPVFAGNRKTEGPCTPPPPKSLTVKSQRRVWSHGPRMAFLLPWPPRSFLCLTCQCPGWPLRSLEHSQEWRDTPPMCDPWKSLHCCGLRLVSRSQSPRKATAVAPSAPPRCLSKSFWPGPLVCCAAWDK